MGIEEIMVLALGLIKAGGSIAEIVKNMTSDGRTDPTPAELAQIKAHQLTAEESWSAALKAANEGI
jgi:hypothetical protein